VTTNALLSSGHYDDLSVDVSQAKRAVLFWKIGRTAEGESHPSLLKKCPDQMVGVASHAIACVSLKTVSSEGVTPRGHPKQVCRKCAVRFGPK
jgi:hypothetical protein